MSGCNFDGSVTPFMTFMIRTVVIPSRQAGFATKWLIGRWGKGSFGEAVRNRYFFYISAAAGPVEWDIEGPADNYGFARYFGKVLRIVDGLVARQDLTFYVTMSELGTLPSYGQNVVPIILGDELSRVPQYVDRVGLIFKCYGISQTVASNFFARPTSLNFLATAQYAKNWVVRGPNLASYWKKKLSGVELAHICDIPLGYYNSEDLPVKSILARTHDISFAGSVSHGTGTHWPPQHWRSPKTLSRVQMLDQVRAFQRQNPQYAVNLAITPSFGARSGNGQQDRYSETLMDTKVCLVARGTSLETYRYYEALRYGCVLVTEELPPRSYYDGGPGVRLKGWSQLGAVLQKLLSNEDELLKQHQQSLDWWQTKCSEQVVGQMMADTVNRQLDN